MSRFFASVLLLLLALRTAGADELFSVEARLEREGAGEPLVRLSVSIPSDHYLYADSFVFKGLGGTVLEALASLPAVEKKDAFSGELTRVLDHDFTLDYRIVSSEGKTLELEARYQGCSPTTCFMPQRETLRVFMDEGEAPPPPLTAAETPDEPLPSATGGWRGEAVHFRVAARATGYMSVKKFVEFVEHSRTGEQAGAELEDRSVWLALLLILVGGLALNLTPCVLPMLPVNLAIIGAGARAASRGRGFVLGGVYGLGMAIAYGALGLIVVLGGATFGSVNASPWFNGAMAGLFLLLALGMFDVIHIDLARFQRGGEKTGRRTGMGLAFGMGVVSALLAGACVAPVVISVLLWAGHLFARGAWWGLALPFILGLGMALPWPFAGAGLSFLPKPGRWMVWVRNTFGALILLLGIYYAWQTWQLAGAGALSPDGEPDATFGAEQEARALQEGLAQARAEGRPVFLAFGASWCKACKTMEATTLRDPASVAALSPLVDIRYHAEQPGQGDVKEILDAFGVLGLPTYVILVPAETAANLKVF